MLAATLYSLLLRRRRRRRLFSPFPPLTTALPSSLRPTLDTGQQRTMAGQSAPLSGVRLQAVVTSLLALLLQGSGGGHRGEALAALS